MSSFHTSWHFSGGKHKTTYLVSNYCKCRWSKRDSSGGREKLLLLHCTYSELLLVTSLLVVADLLLDVGSCDIVACLPVCLTRLNGLEGQ